MPAGTPVFGALTARGWSEAPARIELAVLEDQITRKT
jgi:hypothetical protein